MHFFIPKNSALSVPLCKPVMFLRHSQLSPQSNPPSQFEACQLWLSNVSEMNRQRPIGLPSLFLTPPCNHPLILTSLMTDRLLAAFPVLVGFPLPLSHSSTHFVFWRSSVMCDHHPEGSASEGCKKHVSVGCSRIVFCFSPQ